MELTNQFRVSVPVDRAWAVLTDLERIAPCMPGAELKEVEGDEYRGVVKVKVGPITAQYKGSARFVEMDQATHRAVLKAEGRDTRGQGNASATVRAELTDQGGATSVKIVTDLAVTGKVAQFGRGVLADVSAKLLDQFVDRLEADVLAGGDGPAASRAEPAVSDRADDAATPEASPPGRQPEAAVPADGPTVGAPLPPAPESHTPSGVRSIQSRPAEPVNLLDAAGGSLAKRLVPAGLGFVLLLIIWRALRRG